jgi:hypothetical protein
MGAAPGCTCWWTANVSRVPTVSNPCKAGYRNAARTPLFRALFSPHLRQFDLPFFSHDTS